MYREIIPKNLTKPRIALLTLVAFTILTSLLGNYLIATIGLIGIITLSFPTNISLLVRLLSAYSLFFVANIISVLFVSYLGGAYNLSVLLPIYAVVSGIFAWQKIDSFSLRKIPLLRSDVLILFLGVVVFALTLTPFTESENRRLEILASGEDNASHYALMNTITANRSYTYFIPPEKAGVFIALRNYPQGMHVNFAINSQISAGKHEVRQSHMLDSYATQISAYFGLLFMSVLLCARRLGLWLVNEDMFIRVTAALSPALVYFVGLGTSKYLFSYGFHSQIVAYFFMLFGLLWLMSQKSSLWTKTIAAALVGVAIAFTWFFLVPVYAVFILAWAVMNWRGLRPNIFTLKYILLILTTAILVIIPFLIQQKGGDGTSVNTPGGVHIPARATMFFFGGISVLYLFTRRPKQLIDGSPTSLAVTLATVCLVFSVAIGIYQLATIDTFAYYFYKSLYILPLLASVFGLSLALLVIKAVIKGQVFKAPLLVIGIPFFLGSVYLLFISTPIHVSQLTQKVNTELIAHVMKEHSYINTPQRSYDAIMTKSCTPGESYLTQRWLGAVLLNDQTLEKARVYHAQLDQVPLAEIVTTYKQLVGKLDLAYDDRGCSVPVDTAESKALGSKPVSELLAN